MNKYSIEVVIGDVLKTYTNDDFRTMYEHFATDVAHAVYDSKPICGGHLYRIDGEKESILYGYQHVLTVGVAMCNFEISALAVGGNHLRIGTPKELFELSKKMKLEWEAVMFTFHTGGKQISFTHSWIDKKDLYNFLNDWEFRLAGVERQGCLYPNKEVENVVDTSWQMDYYIRTEVKQIRELMNTDVEEAKKRLDVMSYILNKGE